ncbi:hypothetical protein Q7526_00870 [Glaesserella parasuis]|nr:hypothetical protein [Glaesserella parasuis]MDP0356456.1 hypothetical protein [Glaesserella parasuis]
MSLAREIATTKPAYICQGWGPQRHANGEQAARAIAIIQCRLCVCLWARTRLKPKFLSLCGQMP